MQTITSTEPTYSQHIFLQITVHFNIGNMAYEQAFYPMANQCKTSQELQQPIDTYGL